MATMTQSQRRVKKLSEVDFVNSDSCVVVNTKCASHIAVLFIVFEVRGDATRKTIFFNKSLNLTQIGMLIEFFLLFSNMSFIFM